MLFTTFPQVARNVFKSFKKEINLIITRVNVLAIFYELLHYQNWGNFLLTNLEYWH